MLAIYRSQSNQDAKTPFKLRSFRNYKCTNNKVPKNPTKLKVNSHQENSITNGYLTK